MPKIKWAGMLCWLSLIPLAVSGCGKSSKPGPSSQASTSNSSPASATFVYVTNSGSNSLSGYQVNTPAGTLRSIAGSPFATGVVPHDSAVSPNAKFVYVANSGSQSISAYRINPANGSLSAIAGSPFSSGRTPPASPSMRREDISTSLTIFPIRSRFSRLIPAPEAFRKSRAARSPRVEMGLLQW